MLAESRGEQVAISPILDGILQDGRDLIRQEVALVKSEVRHEAVKAIRAGIYFVIGASLSLIALVLFAAMLVNVLIDQFPALRMWQSYGIVTLLLGAAAALFISLARTTMQRTHTAAAHHNGTKSAGTNGSVTFKR